MHTQPRLICETATIGEIDSTMLNEGFRTLDYKG